MFEIVFEHTLVMQSIVVKFLPAATAFIVFELSPIDGPRGESEYSLSVSLSVYKLAVIVVAVGPVIVSLAVG